MGNVGILGFLSGFSRFPNFIPPSFFIFQSLFFMSFHILIHSFISRRPSSHTRLRKIVGLAHHRFKLYSYRLVGCEADTFRVILHWILSLSEYRQWQNGWGMTDQQSSGQGPTYYGGHSINYLTKYLTSLHLQVGTCLDM